MQDVSGYKMYNMKSKSFSRFMKGKALANVTLTFVLCFSLNKVEGLILKNQKVTIVDDFFTIFMTVVSSFASAVVCGVIVCFFLSKIKSLRRNHINSMLYMLFSAYLVANIGFYDQVYDFNCGELIVLWYGKFSSRYTIYNFTKQAAMRFR